MQSVHGVQVNASVHAVISVDQGFDPTFVLAETNSVQVFGQFVLWKRSAMVENEAGSADHKGKLLASRRNYLKAAKRREFRYQKKLKEVVKSFSEDNTTDVKNHYTDRTNTDARLLPCKVSESRTVDSFLVYRVCCPSRIINTGSAVSS